MALVETRQNCSHYRERLLILIGIKILHKVEFLLVTNKIF